MGIEKIENWEKFILGTGSWSYPHISHDHSVIYLTNILVKVKPTKLFEKQIYQRNLLEYQNGNQTKKYDVKMKKDQLSPKIATEALITKLIRNL